MKKMKSILPAVAMAVVMAAAMLLAGCGSDSGAMTIGQYTPDEAQKDMYDLAVMGTNESAVLKYDAGTAVKNLTVGYEVYEKGKLKDDIDAFGLSAEENKAMNGFIGLWFGVSESRISTSGTSTSAVTFDTPWKKHIEDPAYSSGTVTSTGIDIKKGEKVYIYGHFEKKGDGDMTITNLDTVMNEDGALDQYDEAYIFYAIFK